MLRIADADEGRTSADFLAGALVEGCRIGKFLVIEDIIKVETLDTRPETAETDVFHGNGNVVVRLRQTNFIILARLPIKQIDTDLIAVETEVPVLQLTAAVEVGNVDGIA